MAATNSTKTPSDYLADIENLKNKMKGLTNKENASSYLTGAAIGAIIGGGYSIIKKKKFLSSALIGALIGSVFSIAIMNINLSKKKTN